MNAEARSPRYGEPMVNTRDTLDLALARRDGGPPPEWRIADAAVPYEAAIAAMDERVAAIAEGRACELVWLLEHPPLYTAGTSAKPADLVAPDRFPDIEPDPMPSDPVVR